MRNELNYRQAHFLGTFSTDYYWVVANFSIDFIVFQAIVTIIEYCFLGGSKKISMFIFENMGRYRIISTPSYCGKIKSNIHVVRMV